MPTTEETGELPKAHKSHAAQAPAKSSGKRRMLERQSQGHTPSPSMAVPHLPMTEARKQTFLARLAETGNISQAASQTDGGIGSARSYRRLQSQDPAFARAIADAIEGYAARVNEAVNHHALVGDEVPLVSGGITIRDPVTKKPVYVRKISEKILLQLARSTNAAMRDHKVVTNQNGQPIDDPNDPKIILSVSDLQRLDLVDSELLIALCRKVYANRVEEFSGPDMKTISKDIEGDYQDVTPVEAPEDRATELDPWELEEIEEEESADE